MITRLIYYKTLFIAFLLVASNAMADDGAMVGWEAQKTKKVIRTYQVSSRDALSIDNKYGSVTVNTWDKSEFRVEVTITAYEDNEESAQQQLDRVSISDSKVGNEVKFVTNIESKGNWGRQRSSGGKQGLEINYVVNMPKSNPLSISNKYGATIIPDFNGALSINESYGSFSGGKLNSSENAIIVKYGSATIESIKKGNLDISYSKLILQKADDLTLAHRYGSLELGEVNNFTANIDYSSIRINAINQSGNINTKYSSGIKLLNVPKTLKSLAINSAYSGVNLNFDDNATFDVAIDVSYGDFGYDKDKGAGISKVGSDDKDWKPSKSYSGRYGTGASNGKIAISVKYGSVRFN
ncbi:hypothetical protein [Solitalea lacus]|uniref:hypothetical protein n=1 Tax=Solitalea lacus TaxID=2911172 RepID=UPI001EDB3669|nr:hypothetical protein [Solitalea lacus]UKJ07573.1 hypothetical protein L2B55_00065 [Solitalea lacus]